MLEPHVLNFPKTPNNQALVDLGITAPNAQNHGFAGQFLKYSNSAFKQNLYVD